MNDFDIKNKIIILTGGSGKLGSIYSQYLISNGAIVCNFDLTEPDQSGIMDEKKISIFKN